MTVFFIVILYKIHTMIKDTLMETTIQAIKKLPDNKLVEVAEFVDSLSQRLEVTNFSFELAKLSSTTKSLDFLKDEEELYSIADLKEVYNG